MRRNCCYRSGGVDVLECRGLSLAGANRPGFAARSPAWTAAFAKPAMDVWTKPGGPWLNRHRWLRSRLSLVECLGIQAPKRDIAGRDGEQSSDHCLHHPLHGPEGEGSDVAS